MKSVIVVLACLISEIIFASPGDTTIIRSHDKVHLTWYGNYDRWAAFPDGTKNFYKIQLIYTLGCPDMGCSDWDYTTKVELLKRTGVTDSILNKYPYFKSNGNTPDSLPYSQDTTWTTFFNQEAQTTDSIINPAIELILFSDAQNPSQSTDTISVWKSGYYNFYYNQSGDIVDSIWIEPHNTIYQNWYEVYSYFEKTEPFELARVMTPYGGTFNKNWSFTYYFDITDFSTLLKDSVEIRVLYSGYQDGFTATLDFVFIEGTPPQEAFKIENVWQGNFPFGFTSNPIENYLCPKKIFIENQAKKAKLRFTASGHSFGGNEDCAEFCPKHFYLKANGTLIDTSLVWKNDCGLNPIFPQAGTWLYDRAGWCPGSPTITFEHDLTNNITPGDSISLDIDVENYIYNGGAGFDPSYIFESQLVQYKQPSYSVDAEIIDIISPNTDKRFSRHNPSCGTPVIIVKNNGTSPVTSIKFKFGYNGNLNKTLSWTGFIGFLDQDTIKLTYIKPDYSIPNPQIFEVEIETVNGINDEINFNNRKKSLFNLPDKYEHDFYIKLTTNKFANENYYEILNTDGVQVYLKDSMDNQTSYIDTMHLVPGCYEFILHDSDKDGLGFWANEDGNGSVYFRQLVVPVIINLQKDFGTELHYSFYIPGETDEGSNYLNRENGIHIFPNPASKELNIVSDFEEIEEVRLLNLFGKTLFFKQYEGATNLNLDICNINEPVCLVQLKTQNSQYSGRIIIIPK